MCFTLTPPWLHYSMVQWCRAHRCPKALPVNVYAVVAVLVVVVGCPLHFDLKAVWFAKHAGWSGYTTGMAGETAL